MVLPDNIFGLPVHRLGPVDMSAYPLYYSGQMSFEWLDVKDTKFIAIIADSIIDLRLIRKIANDLSANNHGAFVVICSPLLSFYQREQLAKDNIAFIVSPNLLSLPFLGTIVQGQIKMKSPVDRLSTFAQVLLLGILNESLLNKSLTEISEKTGKSLPYVSRCLDEVEAICPSLVVHNSKGRSSVNTGFSRLEVFEQFKPYLTSPVKRRYAVTMKVDVSSIMDSGAYYAGLTALSAMTMLDDSEAVTFAVHGITQGAIRDNNDSRFDWNPADRELVSAYVEVWKYHPQLSSGFLFPNTIVDIHNRSRDVLSNCVEPLSLYLSLQQEASIDARVHKECEKLLEEVLGERVR